MKKLFVILFLGMVLSSCGLTRQGTPQEVNGTTEDFYVTFLFECNGVEIYRFMTVDMQDILLSAMVLL